MFRHVAVTGVQQLYYTEDHDGTNLFASNFLKRFMVLKFQMLGVFFIIRL